MLRVRVTFLAEQLLLMCSTRLGRHYSLSNQPRDSLRPAKTSSTPLPDPVEWVDGSGLSRLNLITPRTLTGLLLRLHQELPERRLLSLLAAGGGQGTLRKRYHDAAGPLGVGQNRHPEQQHEYVRLPAYQKRPAHRIHFHE